MLILQTIMLSIFFKYRAKLLGRGGGAGDTVVQINPNQANGILENAMFALPLKYLSNFW